MGFTGSGRRTLFRLLTRTTDTATGHTTKVGVVKIPDRRLAEVARIQHSRTFTPATVELLLIPGLAKGDSRETLDLPALRNVDVLVPVVRAFEDPTVAHPEGSVDPNRDIEFMELELALADLAVVEKRIDRLQSDAKKGKKSDPKELASLERAKEALASAQPLRAVLSEQERDALRGYALLTAKPCLYLINVGEAESGREGVETNGLSGLSARTDAPGVGKSFVSARIEAEIDELPPEEARAFREDLALTEGTTERIVRAVFDLAGMLTFYTAEEKEARAWTVARGTRAAAAAGAVHSDMERGFIRAEVVPFDVLEREGSWSRCRDKGLIRLEGKDYEVADGDVIYFRFHV